MMKPPIGFVSLAEAVDAFASRNPSMPREDIEIAIAEACEGGRLAAAYRSILGADELENKVWRSPAWRNYFATGTIDLDLPLLDERDQPSKEGFTARCTREIFIRRDSLMSLLAEQGPLPHDEKGLRPATEKSIREEIRSVYLDPQFDRPNVNELAKVVRPRLNAKGYETSDRQIRKIGESEEFASYRRPVGQTKASERGK
ncbi:hypothetical protein [Bradyrhizobium sp. STM 3557]|uniref:hypothetical protein n=1 Tax=Bradyrhizobium sp. STM 3557 TaxID=578920 RepID=UPI00388EAD54